MKDDRLRVLLFSPFGCGEHYNGPASFVHRLYSVDPGRFHLTLLHGLDDQSGSEILDETVRLRRFDAGPIGLSRWIRDAKRWLDDHASRFDVLHGLLGFHCTMAPAHHAETRLGLPAAVFIANHRLDLATRGGLKGLLRLGRARQRMATELSAVIGMSGEIRDELRGYGVPESSIADIPMGVDLDRFRRPDDADRARLRASWGLGESRVIAFSGQVSPRKRPHLLIEALAEGVRRGHDWRLLIAGPIEIEEYGRKCRELSEAKGVADRIVWLGFTRRIEDVYGASDAYCLPSINEGMPASVVEAMASGLPAVITGFSSARDLVLDDSMGRVVQDSSAAVADGLEAVLRTPEIIERSSLAASNHARSRFDARNVLDRYETLFRSISSKPKG